MKFFFVFFLILSLSSLADEYRVVTGDTLSGISLRELGSPVYGRSGSLSKIINLNQKIQNPNLIYPGQNIFLRELAVKDRLIHVCVQKKLAPSSLRILPILSYARLDSKLPLSSQAQALSDLGGGFKLEWSLPLVQKLNYLLSAKYLTHNYEVSTNKFLKKESASMSYLATGVEYEVSSKWILTPTVGYDNRPILKANSASSLQIDSVSGFFSELKAEYKLWYNNSRELWLGMPLKYSFAGSGPSFDTDGGLGYGVQVRAKQSLRSGQIIGHISYDIQNDVFSSVDVNNKFFEVALGYEFFIGE